MTLNLRSLVDACVGLGGATPLVLQGPNSLEEFQAHMEVRGLNDPQSHPRIVLISEGVMGSTQFDDRLGQNLIPGGYTLVPKDWADAKAESLTQWYKENPSSVPLTVSDDGFILAPGGAAIGTLSELSSSVSEDEAKQEAENITSQVVPEPGTNVGEGESSDQEPGGAGNEPSMPGTGITTPEVNMPGPEPEEDEDFTDLDEADQTKP